MELWSPIRRSWVWIRRGAVFSSSAICLLSLAFVDFCDCTKLVHFNDDKMQHCVEQNALAYRIAKISKSSNLACTFLGHWSPKDTYCFSNEHLMLKVVLKSVLEKHPPKFEHGTVTLILSVKGSSAADLLTLLVKTALFWKEEECFECRCVDETKPAKPVSSLNTSNIENLKLVLITRPAALACWIRQFSIKH